MRSVPPADYCALPRLSPPAAYICVIRDVDRDRFRLQAAEDPRDLIDAVLAEGHRVFGIELLAIVATDNLAASDACLYERHHAELGGSWLSRDDYQLRALKKSELRIDDFGSQYISGPGRSHLEGGPRRAGQARAQGSARAIHSKMPAPSLTASRFDPRSSRRRSARSANQTRVKSLRQALDDAIVDIWTRHPWKCLPALALLAFFLFLSLNAHCPGLRISCAR